MIFQRSEIEGVWIVALQPQRDARGFFARAFCSDEFAARGLEAEFVQANVVSNDHAGTLRGLHFQRPPHTEAKLVRCVRGEIFLAVADLRRDSPTYLQTCGIRVPADSLQQVYLPPGVANGYQTLRDDTELHYSMGSRYEPSAAAGYRYDDPTFDIRWPLPVSVISERDAALPHFAPGEDNIPSGA